MFSIYGGAAEFEQWELDKFVTNSCMKEGDEVVFRNSHGETYVVKAFAQGSEILADVPNYLLRTADNILVDLEQGNDRHPECRTTFTVVAQDKPDGYECKYNVPERQTASSGGSGLPAGAKPNQYIVTDGDGNAKWEDKLWWTEVGDTVLPETTLTFNEEMYCFEVTEDVSLVAGEYYTVTYNGVDYICVACSIYDHFEGEIICLDNDGTPFSIFQLGGMTGVNSFDEAESVTIAIRKCAVKKIDKMLLPESVPEYFVIEKVVSSFLFGGTYVGTMSSRNEYPTRLNWKFNCNVGTFKEYVRYVMEHGINVALCSDGFITYFGAIKRETGELMEFHHFDALAAYNEGSDAPHGLMRLTKVQITIEDGELVAYAGRYQFKNT